MSKFSLSLKDDKTQKARMTTICLSLQINKREAHSNQSTLIALVWAGAPQQTVNILDPTRVQLLEWYHTSHFRPHCRLMSV
jgi:hypothetical protein